MFIVHLWCASCTTIRTPSQRNYHFGACCFELSVNFQSDSWLRIVLQRTFENESLWSWASLFSRCTRLLLVKKVSLHQLLVKSVPLNSGCCSTMWQWSLRLTIFIQEPRYKSDIYLTHCFTCCSKIKTPVWPFPITHSTIVEQWVFYLLNLIGTSSV